MLKNLPVNERDTRDEVLIPGSGRFPGVGNGNPFQYSYLGNPMDRRTWQATVTVRHNFTTKPPSPSRS